MRTILSVAPFALALTLVAGAPAQAQGMRPFTEQNFGTHTLIPQGWRRLPPDPSWTGSRFLSPDGRSWLAVYGSPRRQEGIEQHLRRVARAAGEDITYLRRGQGWLVASGYKGQRIFYRKVVLACGGRVFHHVAMEYPAELKRRYDGLVTAVSRSLADDASACG